MKKIAFLIALIIGQAGGGAIAADGLEILLTNDDGYDSAGLHGLRDALIEAGHRVTVVAPLTQQSGTGMKVSFTTLALVEQVEGVWSIDGSPADAVSLGLNRIMVGAPPDVVISGANLGQNLGNNVLMSGTVGAAVTAVLNGVPGIAMSVGMDLAEHDRQPQSFPSTMAAFPKAAAFAVSLLETLKERRGSDDRLLPPGVALNVNYPALPPDAIKGARIAPIGRFGGFRLLYQSVAGEVDKLESMIGHDERGHEDAGSDTALFALGYITISVIEPSWDAAINSADDVPDWLEALVDHQEP